MRKLNSKFKTAFVSEAGTFLQNKDYFAFIELDDYACYVIADGIDDDNKLESAKMAVTSIIRSFTEKPTMKKRFIKKYLKEANEELSSAGIYTKLKASITVVVTDYVKVRYAVAGNTRFHLFRDGALRYKSNDQSLTQVLANKEEVSVDKIATHSERNNLYCYLGQDELREPYISKKIKLIDGDIITLITRGIWENIDEKEIEDAIDEAKEPKELANSVEDMLLSKQLKDIENYTIAGIFIDKTYRNPNREKIIKKIISIAIPILIILIISGVIFNIQRKKKKDNIENMNGYKVSAVKYVDNGNITKANEEYKKALEIATKYKLKDEKKSLDRYCKFTEIIIDADNKLKDKKQEEALDGYLNASDEMDEVDNLAKDYVLDKLDLVRNSIKVMDLLYLGDTNLDLKNIGEAEKLYKEAKTLATDLHLNEERKEAMEKLDKIYEEKAEKQKENKEAEEKKKKEEEDKKKEKDEKEKEKLEIEDKAVNHIKQGDTSYSAGDYVGAKMYYIMAKQLYDQIGSNIFSTELNSKIKLMDKKIDESSSRKSKADRYQRDGDEKNIKGNFKEAKVLYTLAKELYEKEGLKEEVKKIDEKLEMINKDLDKELSKE
ncbi:MULTISPECIES: PP2C family protein-serine/threonine phosphatase [unclassified Clostridium]|uniref:PP2C family protein-serine/threonine phosphatase n=1 Tax=unclassified Clostridium TaxID=2614128 RepID=UPI0025B803BF|nr:MULTISPECIES: serine/threonine protein phosphatase [unclassified Clostridium]